MLGVLFLKFIRNHCNYDGLAGRPSAVTVTWGEYMLWHEVRCNGVKRDAMRVFEGGFWAPCSMEFSKKRTSNIVITMVWKEAGCMHGVSSMTCSWHGSQWFVHERWLGDTRWHDRMWSTVSHTTHGPTSPRNRSGITVIIMGQWWFSDDSRMIQWWFNDDSMMVQWWLSDDSMTIQWWFVGPLLGSSC